jgi:hypothetical protein
LKLADVFFVIGAVVMALSPDVAILIFGGHPILWLCPRS